MAVADSSVLPSLAEMMTAVEYCPLYLTSRCLNMTEGHLFVAELRIRIAEEGDWSQLVEALEESELKAESDGRNLREDTESCCSFVRTLDPPLIARPFPSIVSIFWVALAEMEQTKATDDRGLPVVPVVGLVLVE